jgi:hypothetical protein
MKWRDGFPARPGIDDTPCPRPGYPGEWLPPMHKSYSVLVELGIEGVAIDRCVAMGDGEPFWYIYGKRVTGWQPLPKTRYQTGEQP